MAILAVDEVWLREPRLLVPNLRPIGRVRVAENIPVMPKNWFPNNLSGAVGLRDIVTGAFNSADPAYCLFQPTWFGIGLRQNNYANSPSILTSPTTLYGFLIEVLFHEMSSFSSATGEGKFTNTGNGLGFCFGIQTSYLTNELISFYSATSERVSGYCSATDSVITDGSVINRFLFFWDVASSALRLSWNGKEYPVTKSSNAITLTDLSTTSHTLSGVDTTKDRIVGHIINWDRPLGAAFANEMTANPNQFLIPA